MALNTSRSDHADQSVAFAARNGSLPSATRDDRSSSQAQATHRGADAPASLNKQACRRGLPTFADLPPCIARDTGVDALAVLPRCAHDPASISPAEASPRVPSA